MNGKIFVIIMFFLMIICSFSAVSITINKGQNFSEKTVSKQYYICGSIKSPDENLSDQRVIVPGTPPEKWDWRNAEYNGITGDWTTQIKHQGNCGSCWAFGAVAALESVYKMEKGNPEIDIDLSEQYLLSCATTLLGGMGCCGASYDLGLAFLDSFGTVNESCFEYQAIDFRGRNASDCFFGKSHEPVRCKNRCDEWRKSLIKIKGYGHPFSNKGIKNALCKYGPLVAHMTVYRDFYEYDGGIYKHESGGIIGGHLVTIVGYDDSQGYWICKNSWGTDWGEKGWFKVAYGECDIEEGVGFITGIQKIYFRSFEKLIIFNFFDKNLRLVDTISELSSYKNDCKSC